MKTIPPGDRTKEHLGVSDTAIIQIRRLLIETLNHVAQGATPPGLDPRSYCVRSTRFTLPRGEAFGQAVSDHVRATPPAYAE